MWKLKIKVGDLVAHVYKTETWQELDKIFTSLLMCEEHAEDGMWEYIITHEEKESTDGVGQDWIGA